ncbi:hypothetical protein [Leptospira levettii]|nr:hypothetical protein [Leptospira levettii]
MKFYTLILLFTLFLVSDCFYHLNYIDKNDLSDKEWKKNEIKKIE